MTKRNYVLSFRVCFETVLGKQRYGIKRIPFHPYQMEDFTSFFTHTVVSAFLGLVYVSAQFFVCLLLLFALDIFKPVRFLFPFMVMNTQINYTSFKNFERQYMLYIK